MGKDDIKHRFSLIPVSLIRTLYTSKNAYNDLLNYGICDASFRMFNDDVWDLKRACRHAIYCWFRKRDSLTERIANGIQELENYVEPYYECFDTLGNVDEELVMSFRSYAKNNEPLDNHLLEWYRVTKALEAFQLSCSSVESVISAWERLAPSTYSKDAFCPISLSFIIEWSERDKVGEDRAKLALYMGISSIIGMKKKFALTTKGLIVSRMFGCNTTKDLDSLIKHNKDIADAYKKFSSRRIYEKLRDGLLTIGLVKVFLGYGKRTIVSTRYDFESIKTELASRYRKKHRQSMRLQRDELKALIDSS